MCYWTALHAGHVRFSFVFCACKLFLDESSMAFIYFFYRQVTFLEYCKKVKGQLPPPSLKKLTVMTCTNIGTHFHAAHALMHSC